jgi:membrane protein YqaA with SNARE-associated domain
MLMLTFIWAFSEANVFFVIPDVIISLCALAYGWRAGVWAICGALVGAMLGGVVAYYWGQADIDGVRAFYDQLPAIAPSTIARAGREIAEGDYGVPMLIGAFTSVPFKLYAIEAGATGQSLVTFVALTPFVRFPRFVLAALFALAVRRFAPQAIQKHRLIYLAAFWLVFYTIYWTAAPH